MKNFIVICVLGLLSSFALVGCDGKSSDGFVGHWVERAEGEGRKPRELTISMADGAYDISEIIYIAGERKALHEVGRAESKSVISVKNGFRNIQLKDGNIIYRDSTFLKDKQ